MADVIFVELEKTEHGWQLLRGGEPYFIRGAGGDASLQQLAAAGANSVRTWNDEGLDRLLDAAHALNLSVTVGLWLGHERHGFDYGDDKWVREQFESARQTVSRYKNYPAVLLWGIGNEMEGFDTGDNPAVWTAVNDIAAMIKRLDPAHPTMTVTAEIGAGRTENLDKCCPDVDIHGVNTYAGARSLAERYRASGASKPYILTEFGPPGPWESPTTAWGAPYEATSTEKAAFYRESYQGGVLDADGIALGSYAFLWGWKMEATATWFGMFLDDGARLGVIDTMTELWSGRKPANPAPAIEPLLIDGPAQVGPGTELRACASVAKSEGTALRARWALRPESGEYATGGDFRPMLPDIDGAILEGDITGTRVRMPDEPGSYRLFFYAYDEAGNAATANVPLMVSEREPTR